MRCDFKISYSRISTYLFCPHKYKLVYLDNFHVPLNADIGFGNIIHKTLELFHGGYDCSYDNLLECYNNSWKNDGFVDSQQIFEYYMRGKRLLKNYHSSFLCSDAKILFVERAFDTNIGKYRFIGIIDRIDRHPDNTYEIIDYKTHLEVWKQDKINEDLQLSFYAYACKNVFGINPDKLSIYFLSKNKKVYTKRSKGEIFKAINIALKIAEDIVIENFEPNVLKCRLCDFKLKCKYSENKSELEDE